MMATASNRCSRTSQSPSSTAAFGFLALLFGTFMFLVLIEELGLAALQFLPNKIIE